MKAGDPIPVGATIAAKVVDELARSKSQPLGRVLFALGIRHVGKSVGELIAGRFPTVDALVTASEEDIAAIDGIGPKIAESVRQFLSVPENLAVLDRLRAAGLTGYRLQWKKAPHARRGGGGPEGPRREGDRLGVQEDQLRGGGPQGGVQAREGGEPGRAGAGRGGARAHPLHR